MKQKKLKMMKHGNLKKIQTTLFARLPKINVRKKFRR